MAPETKSRLQQRIRELQARLDEAEETISALRSGEVDAIVTSGPDGEQVFTLRGADEPYRVMVQGMAEGALTLTADGLILFSNQQFAAMVRRPLEKVIGSRIQEFVLPEDAGAMASLLGGGTIRKAEVRLKTDAGPLIPVYLSVENLVLDETISLCLIVTDLSEQKRNEETLAVMEAVPAAVFIAQDAECRNIVGNRMAYKLLRLPYGTNISRSEQDNGVSKTWREMKDGKPVPTDQLPIQTAARTGNPVHDYEFDVVFEDGTSRCWLGNAVPLCDEAGRSRGAVGAFVDITERKRADERLQQTQKLEGIGLLAGGIAHDFNNLLVGVIGNASLAQEMLPPESHAVELLQRVIKTGEQLANLTRQILAYSGKGRFFMERLNLSDLAPEMNGLIQPTIPKQIAIQFELGRDLPLIEADRGQMHQVFMNLVLNAAEAIGSKPGVISVMTGVVRVDESYLDRHPEIGDLAPGTYVYLAVRDTGEGMDAETRSRMFDPFFTTKFTGRGLGLAAVSGIVRGHKGAIQVTSEPGAGSCFTVLFPVAGAPAERGESPRQRTSPNGTGTVLVVDDEAVVRDLAKNALSRYGFDVLLANNGLEAVRLVEKYPGEISLVVLDLSMPAMSGEQALPELRKLRPGLKVLVSSGYNEAETLALFKGHPVSGFIQKPYTSRRLAEKVKSTLS